MPLTRRWLVLLFTVLLAASWFGAGPARANVVCTPGNDVIDFGASLTATGTISYTCTNYSSTPVSFTLCHGIGNPSYPGTAAQPRLQHQSSGASLAFNMYVDAAATQIWTRNNPLVRSVTIPANGAAVSGSFRFYGRIAAGQQVPTGAYIAYFFNTVLGFIQPGNPVCQNAVPNFSGQDFNLTVNAARADSCELGVSSAVDFGTQSGLAKTIDGVGSVRLQCPIGRGWTLSFDGGRHAMGSDRQMRDAAGDTLVYRLYSDTARTSPIAIAGTITGTGTAAVQTMPIYGRVTLERQPPVGSYADTVIVVLKF